VPETVSLLLFVQRFFSGRPENAPGATSWRPVLGEVQEAHRCGGADRLKPSFLLDAFADTVPLSRVNPEQGNTGPARRIVIMDE